MSTCHCELLNKGPVDEALIEAGTKLDRFGEQRAIQQLRKLVDRQGGCVRPFVENIEMVECLYNHSLSMVFDKDSIYLGIADEAS